MQNTVIQRNTESQLCHKVKLPLKNRPVSSLKLATILQCSCDSGVLYIITFSFVDPPEIEIEQNWYQRDGDEVEVELICVVHAKPEGEVRTKMTQSMKNQD